MDIIIGDDGVIGVKQFYHGDMLDSKGEVKRVVKA